jgi:hypothetical protein
MPALRISLKPLHLIMFVCLASNSIFAQVGNVGINTTSPAAMLHVKDSSVLFSGAYPLPGTPGNPPVSGPGTRMMWYPERAAFRTGIVSGDHWNRDSIGWFSLAAGYNSKATSTAAIALGQAVTASGYDSFAAGGYSKASGSSSIAMGNSSNAMGIASVALGNGAIANGDFAISIGKNTNAIGSNSIAMGQTAIASGLNSTAIGYEVTASGLRSTALGYLTTANGAYSTGLGYNNIASGIYSTAFGNSTTASGYSSTSMGLYTEASGFFSTAAGFESRATGFSSHALGYITLSSGNLSTTIGSNIHAKSYHSIVIGRYNDTSSVSPDSWVLTDPLFIIGNGSANNTRSNALTVLKNGKIGIGLPNPGFLLNFPSALGDKISLHGITESHYGFGIQNHLLQIHADIVDSDIAFGYGNSADFTETMRIKGNGNIGINTNSADAKLHIIKAGPSGGGYNANSSVIIESDQHSFVQFSNNNNEECGFLSGNEATSIRSGIIFSADSSIQMRTGGNLTRMVIDKNGNTAIGSFSPSFQFQVGSNSAAKPTSNTWTVASDARLKKDVHEYKDGLDELLKIKPVWFTYTGEAGLPRETGVGVLAQDLREIAPYMVGTWEHKDSSGNSTPYLSVDNGAMTYMLINAVKEQQETISTQQEQIDFLLNEIAAIKEKIQSQ